MSFYITGNNYPHISGMPEMPGIKLKKPYYRYFYIVNPDKNKGYPAFPENEDMPSLMMRKLYPHGFMLCMGDDVNEGYPCIPEIFNININKFSSLYINNNLINNIYYNNKYISSAYCNEREVFSIKYIY